MPSALLVKCPKALAALDGGTAAEVGLTMADWAAQYHDCRALHGGLVDALKGQVKPE